MYQLGGKKRYKYVLLRVLLKLLYPKRYNFKPLFFCVYICSNIQKDIVCVKIIDFFFVKNH